ncbi:hypothetical protein KIM372_01660 [Bombiscardovia nodaiensis]|uniref:Uncharacterized protein n=1 Tax=Bombiscardovia nodaiensis TaxID=2932181 RepID=A0ABM8B5Z6_9BIFI|nr:hypothetical protein KIM372_01660 [Bombiscardovia nodaiensis]
MVQVNANAPTSANANAQTPAQNQAPVQAGGTSAGQQIPEDTLFAVMFSDPMQWAQPGDADLPTKARKLLRWAEFLAFCAASFTLAFHLWIGNPISLGTHIVSWSKVSLTLFACWLLLLAVNAALGISLRNFSGRPTGRGQSRTKRISSRLTYALANAFVALATFPMCVIYLFTFDEYQLLQPASPGGCHLVLEIAPGWQDQQFSVYLQVPGRPLLQKTSIPSWTDQGAYLGEDSVTWEQNTAIFKRADSPSPADQAASGTTVTCPIAPSQPPPPKFATSNQSTASSSRQLLRPSACLPAALYPLSPLCLLCPLCPPHQLSHLTRARCPRQQNHPSSHTLDYVCIPPPHTLDYV